MSEGSVRDRVVEVFARFLQDPAELEALRGGKPIAATLSLDSLTTVRLVQALEHTFDTRFDYENLERVFESLDTIVAHVEA